MAQSDDGLMLSLSLGFREKDDYNPPPPPPPQVSPLIPFKSSLPVSMQQQQQQINKCPRSDAFQFSSDHSTDQPRINSLRGIDVNRSYLSTNVEEEEEEAPVSSPISTLSSVSGKRSDREEHDGERASSSDEEGGGDMSASRKKLRLCKEQAMVLEEAFREHNTLNPKQKMALAKRLNLRPRQVEVWFQNRRARTKLKQTEVDCEYLKRYCDNLTEENRRLQKELNDLRALKLSPKFYTNTSPPTTLTMCPQCERVNVSMSTNITSLAATKPVETSRGSLIHHSPHQMMPLTSWAAMIRPQPIDSQHL